MATSSAGAEIPLRPIEPAFALIEQIQTAGLGHQVQVRVIASGALSCVPFRLANPDRLVLDCTGAHVQIRSTPSHVGLDPVRTVRVGQFKVDVARVVIDLEGRPT